MHEYPPYQLPTERFHVPPEHQEAQPPWTTVLSPGQLGTLELLRVCEQTKALPAPEVTLQRIEFLCQREGTVPPAVFLAVLITLLHRYTGRNDLVVLVADEFGEGVRLVRTHVPPGLSFRALLRQLIAALERAPRQPADSEALPCQVMFGIGSGAVHDIARFPFEVCFHVQRSCCSSLGMVAALHYNGALFDKAAMDRMAGHVYVLLAHVAMNPDAVLAKLPLLTEAEEHQILVAWNRTAGVYPPDLCIHELFEAQAARNPGGVAVVHEERQRTGVRSVELTYAEANARANQLARYLHRFGVQPGDRVGVFLPPSGNMVVALLGILKADAAYVAVEPGDFVEGEARLAPVLKETNAVLLITEQALLDAVPELPIEALCLDADRDALEDLPQENLPCASHHVAERRDVEGLAYVYASGPIGSLRGVCGHHAGVVNLVRALADQHPLGPCDACSLWSGIEEPTSIAEVWSPLLSGAALHIPPESVRHDAQAFVAWLACRGAPRLAQRITSAYLPATFLPALAERQAAEAPLPLRRLVIGGQRLDESMLVALRAQTPGLCLLTSYGPIEAGACALLYVVPERNPVAYARYAPIGRPLPNVQAYVLDAQRHPVPVGVAGELYIGGIGVARGYLNQAERTAERFVPDPFSDEPEARLYRTGDRVRWLPGEWRAVARRGGVIEFIERVGEPVELHGFRVEPRESGGREGESGTAHGGAGETETA